MDQAYGPWVGQAVVLQISLGECKFALRGKLLKDCGDAVRIRIGNGEGEGWDVDIYKPMILAVEQDAKAFMVA